jgi:hypothetical protein
MPLYEFICHDTNQRFELFFKSVAEYEQAQPTSPYTGSRNVSRVIGGVAVHVRGGLSLKALAAGDESALAGLQSDDPVVLGRTLRALGEQSGEDMGSEFQHIVGRLEAGEPPDSIESSLDGEG